MQPSNEAMEIKKATENDIPFLVETIVAAEKSGTSVFSYATLFEVNENKVKEVLTEILSEDIVGQELCVSDFLIAYVDGIPAGAVCGWIEGAEGPSNILKSNVLMFGFGKEHFGKVLSKAHLMEPLTISREEGSLQLESIYVSEKFRGMGIVKALIDAHLASQKGKNPEVSKAQIILAKDNDSALRAYEKAGFNMVLEKFQPNAEILKYLPTQHKILMEKQF